MEARVRATPDTPYPVADISQTLAAVLVLQCAEERRLAIDDADPAATAASVPEPAATLRQVLSHTSAGAGESFRYEPERYAQLTPVVETVRSAAVSQDRRGERPRTARDEGLGAWTRPHRFQRPDGATVLETVLERYQNVLETDRRPVPRSTNKKRATRSELALEGINAATGLVTTVRDFARFDAAIDEAVLLRAETLEVAWSARHDRPADDAPHRTRMVRPDLSRRTRRLALRAHRERLLIARREAPVPSSDVHPVRQQRRPELAVPARRRRRHALTLCHRCSSASTPRTPLRTPVRVLALVGVARFRHPVDRARGVAADAVSRPHLQGRHDAHRSRAGGRQDPLDLRRLGCAHGSRAGRRRRLGRLYARLLPAGQSAARNRRRSPARHRREPHAGPHGQRRSDDAAELERVRAEAVRLRRHRAAAAPRRPTRSTSSRSTPTCSATTSAAARWAS